MPNIMKIARVKQDKTMQQMAKKVGVHVSAINEYEGNRRVPSFITGMWLAKCYNLKPQDLLNHFKK